MQSTYSRYKELKRLIRDNAAIDIQRVYRGYQIRSRTDLTKFRSQIQNRMTVRDPYTSSNSD
jgi:hypothetical protein